MRAARVAADAVCTLAAATIAREIAHRSIRKAHPAPANAVVANSTAALPAKIASKSVGHALAAYVVVAFKTAALLREAAKESVGLAHPAPAHIVLANQRTAFLGFHARSAIAHALAYAYVAIAEAFAARNIRCAETAGRRALAPAANPIKTRETTALFIGKTGNAVGRTLPKIANAVIANAFTARRI